MWHGLKILSGKLLANWWIRIGQNFKFLSNVVTWYDWSNSLNVNLSMFPLHYTASLISQYWDATGYNIIYTHVGGIEAEPVMLDQTINWCYVGHKLIKATSTSFITIDYSTKIEYIEAYLKVNKMYRNCDESQYPVYSEVSICNCCDGDQYNSCLPGYYTANITGSINSSNISYWSQETSWSCCSEWNEERFLEVPWQQSEQL